MRVLDVKILVLSSRSNEMVGEFKSKYLNWIWTQNKLRVSSRMETMLGDGDPSILGDW